jgi:hypothetical protein
MVKICTGETVVCETGQTANQKILCWTRKLLNKGNVSSIVSKKSNLILVL